MRPPAIAVLGVLPLLETASAQNETPPASAARTFEVASVKVQPPPNRTDDSFRDNLARTHCLRTLCIVYKELLEA
jgi:hypothetical protein